MTPKEKTLVDEILKHASALHYASCALSTLLAMRLEAARNAMVVAAAAFGQSANARTDSDMLRAAKRLARAHKRFQNHDKELPGSRLANGEWWRP